MSPFIEEARSGPHEGHSAGLKITDVTIPTAGVLTLFATAVEVLAAPGAGFATILVGVIIHKPAGTAYAGIAAGEDLALNYTNDAGLQVASCEMTGFADSTAVQTRWLHSYRAASLASQITPVANAAIIAQMLVGEITTGDSDFLLRLYHRTIPMVLS